MNKLFIIGLPRTGTTSISVSLLERGFKVAHTGYTKRAFELADVISDAPCFCDYPQLDKIFPDSKFVYLERALEGWLPSIQLLLKKMQPELDAKKGYLHPVLKRSISTTFGLSHVEGSLNSELLAERYLAHQKAVFTYFANRNDLLTIDVSQRGSLAKLLAFLNIPPEGDTEFPHLNIGKQVDNWREIKHPNKINSLSAGKEHRRFFDYS